MPPGQSSLSTCFPPIQREWCPWPHRTVLRTNGNTQQESHLSGQLAHTVQKVYSIWPGQSGHFIIKTNMMKGFSISFKTGRSGIPGWGQVPAVPPPSACFINLSQGSTSFYCQSPANKYFRFCMTQWSWLNILWIVFKKSKTSKVYKPPLALTI